MIRGKIVEQGTHNELLNLDGLYRKLIEAQTLQTGSKVSKKIQEKDPDTIILPRSSFYIREDTLQSIKTFEVLEDIENGNFKKTSMSTLQVFLKIFEINKLESSCDYNLFLLYHDGLIYNYKIIFPESILNF